ncbi:hypothetical protein KF707_08650 [Candidatus Obscuribacterales bacterium]|nr:hypothetical protein [Candidatus Obscuribacterales bacterium]MBX3148751.1 hypothetical protein [Candidatus Obscuribacterales bacterium]
MPPKVHYQLSALTLALAASLSQCLPGENSGACALDLQGKVDTTHATGGAGGDYIQGGIKNEATIEPSVKVIPEQSKRRPPTGKLQAETPQYFFPANAKLTQFHGSQQIGGPRTPSPFSAQTPSLDVQQFSGNRGPHQIAPISSYTLMPRTSVQTYHNSGWSATSSVRGVTSYVPGYDVTRVDTHKGVSGYAPGHAAQQPYSSQKGVATFSPGYEFNFTRLTPLGGLAHGGARPVPGPVVREGVTAYAPGFETVPVASTTHSTISTSSPGRFFNTPTTSSTTTTHVPGYQVTIKTPKSGVVCWDSSYETSHVSNNLIKNTLGGMWFHNPNQPEHVTPETAGGPGTDRLAMRPMFAVPVVAIPEKGLQALPLGLTGNKTEISAIPSTGTTSAVDSNTTWGEWYKRVARAVYRRWQNADVGPGNAKVSVTVNPDRTIVGRVLDFTPAADVERNVEQETAFKKAALDAVNLVSEFEIPEFPSDADGTAVSFEVEMKREVDGPVGFDVASVPGAPSSASLEPLKERSPNETAGAKPAGKSEPKKNAVSKPISSKKHK